MKQQLGIQLSKDNPVSYIISMHLVQLQQNFGGIALSASVIRCMRDKLKSSKNFNDIHISNLIHTYGKENVQNTYNLIFTLNNERNAI